MFISFSNLNKYMSMMLSNTNMLYVRTKVFSFETIFIYYYNGSKLFDKTIKACKSTAACYTSVNL